MGIRVIEKQFENCEGKTVNFISNTFPARKSIKYFTKLIKIKSSIFGNINFDSSKKLMEQDLDVSKLVKSIGENLDNDDLYDLIVEMLSFGKIDAKELNNSDLFDDIFSSDIALMLEILAFVLYENYNNIFKKKLFSNLKKTFKVN